MKFIRILLLEMNYSPKDIYSRIALTSNSDITYPSFLTVVLKSTRPSFFDKAGCTRQFESNFHCAHWHRFFPLKKGFFRKPTRPSLPLRKAPPLFSVFSPQGRRGNRSSCRSEPLRYKADGPSEVSS